MMRKTGGVGIIIASLADMQVKLSLRRGASPERLPGPAGAERASGLGGDRLAKLARESVQHLTLRPLLDEAAE